MASKGLKLFDLLEACKGRLKESAYFDSVSVMTENDGDLQTDVNSLLAKLRLLVVIGDVEAVNNRPNASAPVWLPINFSVVVTEQVLINRSKAGFRTAQAVADEAAEQLHHFVAGDWGCVVAKSYRAITTKDYNIYEITFKIGE